MEWYLNERGHLDLSDCLIKRNYDMFKVEKLARTYYYDQLTNLVAWDGTRIKGMENEREFLHLICKHNHAKPPLNQLIDIDLKRVERLPLLKAAVTGNLPVNVYRQMRKNNAIDKIEIVVQGIDINYMVVLGCVKDYYVVRSAYPAEDKYAAKIQNESTLIAKIRP